MLPWLLAAAIFTVYCLTLNHWVTLFNYQTVAKLSGWSWQPDIYNPLFVLVTYPFRWLPTAQISIALNFFFRRVRGVDDRTAGDGRSPSCRTTVRMRSGNASTAYFPS